VTNGYLPTYMTTVQCKYGTRYRTTYKSTLSKSRAITCFSKNTTRYIGTVPYLPTYVLQLTGDHKGELETFLDRLPVDLVGEVGKTHVA
jgi:hypothetical protein